MNEYVEEYIIPHLEKYGNCSVSHKNLKKYGQENIEHALKERGYDCYVTIYDHSKDEDWSGRKHGKKSSVVYLKGEMK